MKKGLMITKRVFWEVFHITPISTILVVIYTLFVAMIPALLTIIYEKLFSSIISMERNNIDTALSLGLMICSTYFIRYIIQAIYAVAMNAGIYEKVSFSLKVTISQKTSNLNLIAYEDASTANLKSIATDCVNQCKISQFFMNVITTSTGLIGLISITIVLSTYSIWFLPIAMISVLPYLVSRVVRGKQFFCVREAQIPKLRLLNYIWNLLFDRQSVKEIKSMCSEKYICDTWIKTRDEINAEIWNLRKKDSFVLFFCDFFRIFSYALSILLTLILLYQSAISIGAFGACISAFLSLQQQFKDILVSVGEATEQVQFINKYYEFLDLQVAANGNVDKSELNHVINIKNVTFAYPNADRILKNISISINKGEKIAIIGENGSGKTTLAKIILGLFQPNSGGVFYDDVEINELSKDSKYKLLCSVSQDFIKYCLTYRENIGISDTANMRNTQRILDTIASVGNNKILEKISIDDLLGTEFGGKDLSGGEWQKTAIGRAVFKESQLIILDEPTSALDPIIETDILTLLLNIMSDVTAILISHRVGVCRFVDKIAVLSKGELIEYGSHQELMELKGYYYKLFMEQKQWYR